MIFIVGFMGSGKTTVAEQLGEATGYKAVEMDREIERLEGMTIPEMFERYGEAYFRSAETRFLKGLHGDGIVSTGEASFSRRKIEEFLQKEPSFI